MIPSFFNALHYVNLHLRPEWAFFLTMPTIIAVTAAWHFLRERWAEGVIYAIIAGSTSGGAWLTLVHRPPIAPGYVSIGLALGAIACITVGVFSAVDNGFFNEKVLDAAVAAAMLMTMFFYLMRDHFTSQPYNIISWSIPAVYIVAMMYGAARETRRKSSSLRSMMIRSKDDKRRDGRSASLEVVDGER